MEEEGAVVSEAGIGLRKGPVLPPESQRDIGQPGVLVCSPHSDSGQVKGLWFTPLRIQVGKARPGGEGRDALEPASCSEWRAVWKEQVWQRGWWRAHPSPFLLPPDCQEAGVLLSFRNQRRAWETLFPLVVQCPHLTIEVTEA